MSLHLLFDTGPRVSSAAQLLSASEVWIDPSDLTSLRQDRGGAAATVAAAVGFPVGSAFNKGARGDWLTAASDAARPVLRASAGGRHYLEYDGVDDLLSFAALPLADFSIYLAFRETGSDANGVMPFGGGSFTLGADRQSYVWQRRAANETRLRFDGETGGLDISPRPDFEAAAAVMRIRRQGAAVSVARNGVVVGSTTSGGSALMTLRNLGWSYQASSYADPVEIYQFAVFGRALAAPEQSVLDAYFASTVP